MGTFDGTAHWSDDELALSRFGERVAGQLDPLPWPSVSPPLRLVEDQHPETQRAPDPYWLQPYPRERTAPWTGYEAKQIRGYEYP